MKPRVFALALLGSLCGAQAADAIVLNCLRQPGREQAYVDAYSDGGDSLKPPLNFAVARALIRLGEDEYEFEARHMKQALMGKDRVIRIRGIQDLSAGATAEFRFEGTPAAKDASFVAQLWVRAENREERGTVLCTID
jgi:hypothetical protein